MGLTAASDKVILAARPYLELTKLFCTNYAIDGGQPYSAVAVQVLSASAGDFDASSNDYATGTGTVLPATVTLNKHKKATFPIADTKAVEDDLSPVWSQLAPVAGRAVAKQVVTDIMGLLDYTNREDAITVSNSTLANFTAWRAEVEAKGVDPAECVLVLEPQTFAKLLAVLPANVLGDGGEAIRMGRIAEFIGFKSIVESPLCSKLSAQSTSKGIGFVVPTGAIAVAARTVPAIKGVAGGLVDYTTFQDEVTGFVFDQRVVVDANAGKVAWTVESLYGVTRAKMNSNGAPGYWQLVTA